MKLAKLCIIMVFLTGMGLSQMSCKKETKIEKMQRKAKEAAEKAAEAVEEATEE